jgi:hypothetical protein
MLQSDRAQYPGEFLGRIRAFSGGVGDIALKVGISDNDKTEHFLD